MTDDEALQWLRERRRVETTIAGLARELVMDRSTLRRRLREWEAAGHLTCSENPSTKRYLISMTGTPVRWSPKAGQEVGHRADQPIREEPKKLGDSSLDQLMTSIEQGLEDARHHAGDPPSEPRLLSDLISRSDQLDQHPVISPPKRDQTSSNVVAFRPRSAQGNLAEQLNARMEELQEKLSVVPVAVQPERRRASPAAVFLTVFFGLAGLVMLGVAIAGGVQLAIEKSAGDAHAAWTFGVMIVMVGIIGAVAMAARGFVPKEWRRVCTLISVACIGLTTAYAIGYAAQKFEAAAAGKGHEAAAFRTLEEHVKTLRSEVAALGTPRALAVIEEDLKAAPRLPACQDRKKALECANAKDALKKEKAAAQSLPALKKELAAKEEEWLKAKPVVSADASSAGLASSINWLLTFEWATEQGTRKMLSLYQASLCEALAALCFGLMGAIWRARKS